MGTALFVLLWWIALFGWWIVLVGTNTGSELIAAGVAAWRSTATGSSLDRLGSVPSS